MAPPPSISTSERALQLALALAALGTLLVLVNLFGLGGRLAGVAAMIAGTVLAAPFSERGGALERWWNLLAAGTLMALAGVVIGLAVESLGGLVLVAGGVLAAAAVALSFPAP
jgi:hypothetical protein